MQALLRKIRQILKDRRTRRLFTRVVSSIAAIVVFVTTYALILPAITLEKTAVCGIEEHQHSDSCYEKKLVCGQEEIDGHHHDDSCYTTTKELTCGSQEHRHSSENGCYDADGNLVCELQEHFHDDSCYEEVKTLTCGMEESGGHHHSDKCYEKILICGKEVHTHSEKCYGEPHSTDTEADGNSAGKPSGSASAGSTEKTGDIPDSANIGNTVARVSDPDVVAEEVKSDSYVPELDPLDMDTMLNVYTDFYYFHAKEGEEAPVDSAEITDWKKAEKETVLSPTDLVKMYLAYTIPAGSLNETNPSARYRLPSNLHLSEEQIEAMNHYVNGIAAGYRDSDVAPEKGENDKKKEDNYKKYLGAEAVEGDRRPDELLKEGAQEYISAIVRAENVYDDNGKYLGQDLIFTFVPYSIEKNQNTYTADKTLISAGNKITGWFACDFRLDQIDWEQEKDNKEEESIGEDNAHENGSKKSVENLGNNNVGKTARVVFVEEDKKKDIEEISRVLRMTEIIGEGATAEAQKDQIFKTGTLTAEGDDYNITLDYSKEAKIPENASLSVCEITAETDKEAYKACLEQASQEVSADNQSAIDRKATRFFDIEIVVKETDIDGTEKTVKIEPSAPVSVHIQVSDKQESTEKKSDQSEPTILHFAEEGVEQIDSTVTESQNNNVEEQKTEIRFEADSFSVYGVVYTVDFTYEVNGKVYGFSMQGADTVSLRALVEALHVYKEPVEKEDQKDDQKVIQEDIQEEIQEKTQEETHKETQEETSSHLNNIEAEVSSEDLNENNTENKALDQFMADIESVTFSDESLLVPAKVVEDTSAGMIKRKLKLFPSYPLGLSESEVLALNAKKYYAGDWILISMKAFDTEETLTVKLRTGECFEIKVTDAQDAIMVGDKVQTINNPAGTTIDLFDYWVVSQELAGRDGWGDLDQTQGANEAGDGHVNGTGNNKGINASSDDAEHGHALKFSPAWAGTVYNGSKIGTTGNAWESVNLDGRDGLNSYTGNGDPFEGIVQNTLSGGYPVLTDDQTIGTNGESLQYLFDPNVEHSGKASYDGVNQLLYVDSEGYYTFDSRDYAASLKPDKTFDVTKQTSTDSEIRGFWPFGTQSFWSGIHLKTQFSMPSDGKVLNPKQENKDMQFEFSGDDDVWLYVDGVLVGDGGGIHNRTEIDINFATGKVTVTGKKDSVHPGDDEYELWLDELYDAAGKYDEDAWEDIPGVEGHKRFKAGTYHTFDMFYLERGGGESNFYVHYNLISTVEFSAHKSFLGTERLHRDQFQFELTGLDGQYKKWTPTSEGEVPPEGAICDRNGQYWVLSNPAIPAIMPQGGTRDGEGTVASPKIVHSTDGYTSYITGVTEDGNVNFGQAQISNEERNACNDGDPSSYLYRVREIVPDDAVNENGIRWDQASEVQKAEGGFVKDNVVYDGRVYYWMGTVKAVEILAGDGSTYTDYILSKSRFLDSDYTQPDEETTFFNFSNTYVPDLGGVEFTKVDGAGEGIQGAEFALFTDETCQTPAINIDGDKQAWTAASDEEGLVKFDGVRTGTYYMKETRAPENYALDRTVYKVVIEDSKDTTKVSKITINNDESGTAISTIANTEEGKLSIIKKWISPSGDEEDGGDKSAKVKLYRKLDNSNIPEASEVTVVYHRDGKGWDLDTGTGNVVNVNGVSSFDLLWHLGNSPDHQLYNMKVNGVSVTTQNEVVDLGFARVNWIPWDGSTSKLCVSNIKKNLRIEYTSNCDWFSEKPHVENFVPFISPVIDPTPQEVKTIILNSENNWAVDQKIGGKLSDYEENGYDLPATNDDGYEYLYYVVELDASGNEIEVGGSPVAGYFLQGYSANNNVGVANQGILTIYNKAEEVPASIKIIKVIKGTETALTGAKFALTRVDNNGNEPTDKNDRWTSGEQEVDENGMLTFDNLKLGRYKLEETEAPPGYIKKEGPYFIIVNPDGTTSLDTSIPHTLITKSEDADEYTVQNEPGAALPNTGGPGSAMIYFLGIMLTGLAGAGLVMTKHRRAA